MNIISVHCFHPRIHSLPTHPHTFFLLFPGQPSSGSSSSTFPGPSTPMVNPFFDSRCTCVKAHCLSPLASALSQIVLSINTTISHTKNSAIKCNAAVHLNLARFYSHQPSGYYQFRFSTDFSHPSL